MFPKYFFFFSLLFCSFLIFTHSYDNSQCLNHQKNLLLQFKNELIFNSSLSTKLVRWNQTNNCCHWHGVRCDGAGQVVSLQLDHESISGGIGDSSSLFGLKYLEKLNLAYNDFNSLLIPKGIKHLKYLTHLNLSRADFGGQVPLEISSLRGLVSLDICFDYRSLEPPILEHPNLEMLVQNLTGLRELYLDGVNITSSLERSNWDHIISSHLPHLTTLSMRHCDLAPKSFRKLHYLSVLRLDGNGLLRANQDSFANFSRLTTLSLVDCGWEGSFPDIIFQIPTLQHLDLSDNQHLSGSLPPFSHSGSLESLRLRSTNFSGSIPSSIGNLKTLSDIDLGGCRFGGPIPSTFANLTRLTYIDLGSNFFTGSLSPTMFEGFSNLVQLSMEDNSFTGNIPKSLFGLPSLQEMYLSSNNFTGVIEEFPTLNVSQIYILSLSNNRLEGPIPDSFFQLRSLEYLFLSKNLFNGSFQLEKIQSFANLTQLDMSGNNNLSVHVSNDNWSSYGLPMLSYLFLRSCNMHDFPHFIKQYSNQMKILDLSNNRIQGEIPNWIWGTQLSNLNLSFNLLTHLQKPYNIPPSLQQLELQSNQLREQLHFSFPPNITPTLHYLSLANNSLSGSIPTSLCAATELLTLDLSMNKLSGTIPSCLLDNMNLIMLDLGRNNISGHIPDSFRLGTYLQYLNLSNNTLQGEIPKSLKNCEGLELMNVGNNLINDTFPCMLPSSLRVLVLRSNRFHGEVKCHNNSWPKLQIIDISSNDFNGSLKSVNFSSWKGMVLESSPQVERTELMYGTSQAGVRITMKGLEVEIVKIFPEFTTIDFSSNNFHGEIPKAIGDLSWLRLLNLSHNAINGSIPKSFGKLGDLESLDLSQNQLTGHIPTELSRLTFLSMLNVSYNRLIGEIPKGSQLQTFPADSFLGNPGLCGFNLNISCTDRTDDGSDEKEEEKKMEIEWEYVSTALGYGVGLGGFVWVLIFCRSFRYKYFGKIEEVVEDILDARDRRRRRRSHARRVERNRVVRRH